MRGPSSLKARSHRLLLCACLLLATAPVRGDTLYFRDGRTVQGKILKISPTQLSMRTDRGERIFTRAHIKKISYGTWTSQDVQERRRKLLERQRQERRRRIAREKAIALRIAAEARQRAEQRKREAAERAAAERAREAAERAAAERKRAEEERVARLRKEEQEREARRALDRQKAERRKRAEEKSAAERSKLEDFAALLSIDQPAGDESVRPKKPGPAQSKTKPARPAAPPAQALRWSELLVPGYARYRRGDASLALLLGGGSAAFATGSILAYGNLADARAAYADQTLPLLAVQRNGIEGLLFSHLHFGAVRSDYAARTDEFNAQAGALLFLYAAHLLDYGFNLYGRERVGSIASPAVVACRTCPGSAGPLFGIFVSPRSALFVVRFSI